jgi:hypothetical protein
MSFRIGAAIFISVLLVVGAFWYRSAISYNAPVFGLAGVNSVGDNEKYERFLNEYLTSNSDSTSKQKEITVSSIIGRELLMDYVDLASRGEASDAKIWALAESYVDNIPSITRAATVSYFELKVIPSTPADLKAYSSRLLQIHQEHTKEAEKIAGKNTNFALSPALYTVTDSLSRTYTSMALKLKDVPVPAVVASANLGLINTYLLNAQALKDIAEAETDPARAFAAAVTLDKNLAVAKGFLNEIDRLLLTNGI